MAVAVAYNFQELNQQVLREKPQHLKLVVPSSQVEDLRIYSGQATWVMVREPNGYNMSCTVEGQALPIHSQSFSYQGLVDKLYGMFGAGKTHDQAVEYARRHSPEAIFDNINTWSGNVDNLENQRFRSSEEREWAKKYIALNINNKK